MSLSYFLNIWSTVLILLSNLYAIFIFVLTDRTFVLIMGHIFLLYISDNLQLEVRCMGQTVQPQGLCPGLASL
jgi:hypothetical protein